LARILVYTAIFGNKDDAPKLINKYLLPNLELAFICFTDNPLLRSEDYEVRLIDTQYDDITKNARDIKINGFPGIESFDIAIWHDSSVQLHCDKLQKLVEMGRKHMISAFHHIRYCVYSEAIACINQKKDNPIKLTWQIYRYFKEGLPANYRLHETTIMVIQVEPYVESLFRKIWWNEILKYSRRDQISLPYARYKTGVEVNLLAHWTAKGHDNEFSTYVGHRYHHYNDSWFFALSTWYPVRVLCKKLIFAMRRRR
jgi:hypothetical protein